ncbi:MAG: protein-methionine-sulfoxide reductase catalytic subunit MsrP [Candidatus Latescibacteria bacterium]|jgi:methionine sulfoxide reductase catalytic subunit|nr:protein-methionine-sulfoxide reductase catalytic subunit MsrP [Candidatus Latescibacterota bacterium]
MAYIHLPKDWEIPASQVTDESIYEDRRRFLKQLGLGTIGGLGFLGLFGRDSVAMAGINPDQSSPYPAPLNPDFSTLDRPVTPSIITSKYNNFYEFTLNKDVWKYIDRFRTKPWQIEVVGAVENPGVFDIDELVKTMPLEERFYRFRCVEAWAMAVPWTGFRMKALLDQVKPKSSATHVRMLTFLRPDEAPVQQKDWFPWPYFEALSMAEARNELTLLATGIYGKELPPQHGAPIRLVTPWKYGYKGIKSIVKIEVTTSKPRTFWNDVAPREYSFDGNVNPYVAHPRWSQARERMIDTGEFRDTQLYNGYSPYVSHMYQ